jgi:hypothetical protein
MLGPVERRVNNGDVQSSAWLKEPDGNILSLVGR